MTNGKYTDHGGHLVMDIIIELLCCTSETNAVYQLYFS